MRSVSRAIKAALAILGTLGSTAPHAIAQSSPNWYYGYVPTAAQFNAAFASKQDVLNYRPLNSSGGSMTGRLTTWPSSAALAGFNIPPGVAPATPNNGDIWTTSVGIFAFVNNNVVNISAQPWGLDGSTIFYNAGGVTLPLTVTGGSKGVGTLNATGVYVGGNAAAVQAGNNAFTGTNSFAKVPTFTSASNQYAFAPHAATVVALKAIDTTGFTEGQPIVLDNYYASIQGGGNNLNWTASNCTTNGGAGDNGTEFKPTSGPGCFLGQPTQVLQFGATSNTGNSTSAFQAMAAALGYVRVPCGGFFVNVSLVSVNKFDFGGAGYCAQLFPSDPAKDVVALTGTSMAMSGFNLIHDLFVQGAGTTTTADGSGITLDGYVGVTTVDNVTVQSSSNKGVVFGFGPNASGNRITNSVIVYSHHKNVEWNSNDGSTIGNQYGTYQPGAFGTTQYPDEYNFDIIGDAGGGSANHFTDDKIWGGQLATLHCSSCNYNFFTAPRITQSNHAGAIMGGNRNVIVDAEFYANSEANIGNEPDLDLVGFANNIINNNQFLNWTTTPSDGKYVNYNIRGDSASVQNSIQGNLFSFYATAPTNFPDSAYITNIMQGNFPKLNVTSNNNSVGQIPLPLSTGAAVTFPANYALGTAFADVTSNPGLATPFPVPLGEPVTIRCMDVTAHTAVPGVTGYTLTLVVNGTDTTLTTPWTGSSFHMNYCSQANAVYAQAGDLVWIRIDGLTGAPSNTFAGSLPLQP